MSIVMHTPDGLSIRDADDASHRVLVDESNHDIVRVQNACGFIVTHGVQPHVAWQKAQSIFGVTPVAYTMGGNLCMVVGRIMFKGATNVSNLKAVVDRLTEAPGVPMLQLVVLSVGIGRSLYVHVGCLLETRLLRVPWIKVMNRIEEVCSIVVFYVTDWAAMESALGMHTSQPPKLAAVTLTRKGTLTLRLTWDGIEWRGNGDFERAITTLRDFVRGLV